MIAKKDYLILLLLIICAIGLFVVKFINSETNNGHGKIVHIKEDGKLIDKIPLLASTKFTRTYGEKEYNTVVIDGGVVYVEDASCKDKVCIHAGKISAVGDVIVCLPNRFVVEIVGDKFDK